MNAFHPCAAGLETGPWQAHGNCGIVAAQLTKDCGIEHPAAGQAATRPAWRDPRPPQRDRQRAARGPPAEAIPALESERPQTPFTPAQLGMG